MGIPHLAKEQPKSMTLWYSPGCILVMADRAVSYCIDNGITATDELSKVLGEARPAAFFAMAEANRLETETWVQFVDPREQAPDMRVMFLEDIDGLQAMTTIDVEVASYTRHSSEDLGEFMIGTKLNDRRAYSSHTVIVFNVQRGVGGDEVHRAAEAVSGLNLPGVAFLVGQADDDLFEVQMIYPRLSARVPTRISEALDSPQPLVVDASRGMWKEQSWSEDPIPTANPFLAYVR